MFRFPFKSGMFSASQVFNVEATGQYRKLFKLYALPGTGGGAGLAVNEEKVDIREVRKIRPFRVRRNVSGVEKGSPR